MQTVLSGCGLSSACSPTRAQKAILAVAHRILTALYHMLLKQQPYQDLGQAILISVNSSALCTDCNTELNNLAINSTNLSPLRLLTAEFSKQVLRPSMLIVP